MRISVSVVTTNSTFSSVFLTCRNGELYPQWEEELVINEQTEYLIGTEQNVAIFQLIDLMLPQSSKCSPPLPVAWGYIRPRVLLSGKKCTKAHVHLYKCPPRNTKVRSFSFLVYVINFKLF